MAEPILETIRSVVGGALSVPAHALATAAHGWASGVGVVAELRLRGLDDLRARAALITRLDRLAVDPNVVGLWVRVDATLSSWAAWQDVGEAIGRARGAGKRVVASLEAPGNAAMWLAAHAERVFLTPSGEVGLVGVGVELTFFAEALERIGVTPDFEAAGAYKSFGEPFTRRFASRESQEALGALVADLHAQLVEGVAHGRGLSVEAVEALLARAPLSAVDARDAGLVDHLAYEDEVRAWFRETLGERVRVQSFGSWARRDAVLAWVDGWALPSAAVTVVHLQGPVVVDDRSPRPMIRARRVVEALTALRDNEAVKAVVLHIDSPGGSALASDLIWREVDLLRKAKPVIACFEGVAASGGYYLAAPAAEIVARPGTLTGSIGVFGGKLVAQEGLRLLGVHTQTVAAAPNANLYSPSQPFTDDQRARFKASLQRFYDGFVERVAAGRARPVDEVEPHCRGRVWTGRDARARGLVDRFGGVEVAVERARKLAGLSPGAYHTIDLNPDRPRRLLSRVISAGLRDLRPELAQIADGVLEQPVARGLALIAGLPGEALALLPLHLRVR